MSHFYLDSREILAIHHIQSELAKLNDDQINELKQKLSFKLNAVQHDKTFDNSSFNEPSLFIEHKPIGFTEIIDHLLFDYSKSRCSEYWLSLTANRNRLWSKIVSVFKETVRKELQAI